MIERFTTETTIYLLRHAHAEWREGEDHPLSRAGEAAAVLVADTLRFRPIAAIYTSPFRRSFDTAAPLAKRLGLHPVVVGDLRERELPTVPPGEFESLVRQAWHSPDTAPSGGESNAVAQARALAVVQTVVARHEGSQAVLATHGNLLALIMNGLDPQFGFEFWRRLSFPDIYRLVFQGTALQNVERLWDA